VLSIRKPDEAVVHLEKLVAMDPSDSWAYRPLGVSYRELGRWDEAVTAFQKQIEINPNIKWVNEIAIEVVNEMRKEAEARNRVGIETENTPPEK
jgi:Flp pilus assembly protein TadD